ncbi:hypothetical protein HG530_008620 [Fusarium avenaceum]|nr:hypothetical protein HG530_008620 [Fusarium avenaceum]
MRTQPPRLHTLLNLSPERPDDIFPPKALHDNRLLRSMLNKQPPQALRMPVHVDVHLGEDLKPDLIGPQNKMLMLRPRLYRTPNKPIRRGKYVALGKGLIVKRRRQEMSLDTLDNVDQLREDLLAVLNAADLLDNILGTVLGHDLGKLLGLLVVGDLLEAEAHLNGVEKVLDGLVVLGKLGGGADESLLAGELSERSTANTLDGILEMGVANSLDDLLNVGGLGLLVDLVLGDDQVLGLHESTADLVHDLLVLESIVDSALSSVVTVVSSCGVASVDCEELALDEGSQVVDPVDTLDLGDANILERSAVNNPLEELLECHIKTGVGILSGNDSVDSRVGISGSEVVVLQAGGVSVAGVLDVLGKGISGTNSVLASNDVQGSVFC